MLLMQLRATDRAVPGMAGEAAIISMSRGCVHRTPLKAAIYTGRITLGV